MHKYGALVSSLHANGQHAAATVIVKLSRQADAADKMNALLVDAQSFTESYLAGNSISQQQFIDGIIGILDGPQQREAQSEYQDSKK